MHKNWVTVAELFHHVIHYQELGSGESVCVQFVCKIVVKLWANIMLHWPAP